MRFIYIIIYRFLFACYGKLQRLLLNKRSDGDIFDAEYQFAFV